MRHKSATSINAFSAVILIQRNYWTSTATVTSHCVLSNIIFRNVTGGSCGWSKAIQIQHCTCLALLFYTINRKWSAQTYVLLFLYTKLGQFFRPSSGAYKTLCATLGIVMLFCCLPLVGKHDNTQGCTYSFISSWWWAEKLPETCTALLIIKNIVQVASRWVI